MTETKIEPFKRICIAVCFLMACGIFSSILFTTKDVKAVQPQSEAESCAYTLPPITLPDTPVASSPIAITEEATLPEATEEVSTPNPYADLVFTDTEKELLACMAYSEAGNQSFEGQVAVVQVALNRYLHEAFSGTISEILLAPNQFAVGNYFGAEQMEAVESALAGNPVLDLNTDVVFFSTGVLTYGSYYKTIGDHVFRTYS